MLTNKNLLVERPHILGYPGVQRIYRFKNGAGLSVVDAPILHVYPFAWEIAVLKGIKEDAVKVEFAGLDYSTPLTEDVEVFFDDESANAFIEKAEQYFNGSQEKRVMNVYTCKDHIGIWVGVASVIVAETELQASELLRAELIKRGPSTEREILRREARGDLPTFQLVDTTKAQAIVLQDGDY